MGSIVSLTIGGMEIDWGKNHGYINHSKLFHPKDKTILETDRSEGYDYVVTGYRRKLKDVIPRLELSGYNDKSIKLRFDEHKQFYADFVEPIQLDFDEFKEAVKNITIIRRPGDDGDDFSYDYDLGEFAGEMLRSPEYLGLAERITSQHYRTREFLENLDPYIQLWLIASNPQNHDLDLVWHTNEIINGGWTNEQELFVDWGASGQFLIITEGSSDTYIISEAIALLRPDIKDFFRYIDMTEHYPFTGTGNLFNFYQGLARIGIENKCLIIFDNDTEGVEKQNKCGAINSPKTLASTTLPSLQNFETMLTAGPNGEFNSDINGSAVSIECFLDLSYRCKKPAVVRWTNYNKSMGRYQGSLDSKEHYITQFRQAIKSGEEYDFTKLELLVAHIVEQCVRMAW